MNMKPRIEYIEINKNDYQLKNNTFIFEKVVFKFYGNDEPIITDLEVNITTDNADYNDDIIKSYIDRIEVLVEIIKDSSNYSGNINDDYTEYKIRLLAKRKKVIYRTPITIKILAIIHINK